MKKTTFVVILFFTFLITNFLNAQLIRVNSATDLQSAYSLEDLVKKVLIKNGECYTITNITSSPNFSLTDANRSFGYFNKGTSVFPFQDGILISTGKAESAGNTATGTMSFNNGNNGDADLSTAMIALIPSFNAANVRNAAYIQFDFVPLSNQISFNYIMSSEEYTLSSNFPCTGYADAFALLIKKVTDANYTNIAKLPNNSPVLVTNIHPAYTCAASNVEYYAGTNLGDTNYDGRTIPITAQATVESGQTYRIKMIIADFLDTQYDSGVFLQGGSFDLGLKLVNDTGSEYPLVPGNPNNYSFDNCNPSQPVPLTIVGGDPSWNWVWRYQPFSGGGFTTIPGANSNTYLATQPGYYRVQFSCSPTSPPLVRNITINDVSPPNLNLLPVLNSNCNSSSGTYFNLHNAETQMTSLTSGVTYTYYLNQANWDSNTAIGEPDASNFLSTTSGQTLLVKINYGTCEYKATLTLNHTNSSQPTITASATSFCEGGSVTLTSSATSGNLWSNGATTQSIIVTTAGDYSVTVANGVCTSTSQPVTITMVSPPNAGNDNTLTVCNSDSSVNLFTLLGSNAQTGGTWSPALASGSSTFNPSIDASGNYTYTITGIAPCVDDSAVINVTVNSNPTASISASDTEICSGTATSIIFNGTPNASISYNINGGATQNITLDAAGTVSVNTGNLSANTTYNLLGVALGSCANTYNQSVTIVVDALPTASVTATQTSVCNNTSTTLTFSGTPNALVSFTANGTAQTVTLDASGQFIFNTGNLSTATTYSLTNVSLASTGCAQNISQSVTISIFAIPSASISNNGPICIGNQGTVTITGTPNATVFYTIDGGTSQSVILNASGTATLTTATLSANTTYDLVSVTSTDNCSNSLSTSTTVIATALPIASIAASDTEICSGASTNILFSGTPNATISYNINSGTTQNITLDATGNFTLNTGNLTANTTYNLIGVALGSCNSTYNQSVTIVVVQKPTITGNLVACEGNSSTLSGSGTPSSTLPWTTSDTSIATISSSGVVHAIASGSVTITYTTNLGCSQTATFVVNSLPQISASIAPISLCDDNFDGVYEYNLSNVPRSMYITNPNNYTFEYYTDGAFTNEVSGNYTMNTLPKTLFVKITNNSTGCFNSSTLTFVSGNITPLLSNYQEIKVCDDDLAPINDGKHLFDLTSVQNNINTTAVFEYYTSLASAQQQLVSGKILNPTTYINTVNPQIIYVRVQQSGYCASFAQLKLIVDPIPYDANIETPPVICDGQTGLVRLEVDSSFDSYSWTNEQGELLSTTYFVETNLAGTYYVTMTDGNCSNTQQIELQSYDLPYISDVQYGNGFITITGAGGVPPYEYTFDGGTTWSLNNTFYGPSVDASGNQINYNVGIRNAVGKCEGDYQQLSIVNITTIFTPDGNNINEEWTIKGLNYVSTAVLRIYDRYGKLVYESAKSDTNPTLKWDGKYLGRNLPTATYWYTLDYANPDNTKFYKLNGYIVVKDR